MLSVPWNGHVNVLYDSRKDDIEFNIRLKRRTKLLTQRGCSRISVLVKHFASKNRIEEISLPKDANF